MEKFSRDLSLETRQFGVTVQCVLPSFVSTNMTGFKSSLTVPSPSQFVRGHMNTLGLEVSSPGYWVHKIQVYFINYNYQLFCFFNTKFFSHPFQIGLYNVGLSLVRPVVERIAWYGLFSIRTRAVRRQQRLKMAETNGDKILGGTNSVQSVQS